MGATKRLAEMCVQSLHAGTPEAPASWRFGSEMFLGSWGASFHFQQADAAGGADQVTIPTCGATSWTIPEAVASCCKAQPRIVAKSSFGDMASPLKSWISRGQLIKLPARPDQDIRIDSTGLRPGEKLFRRAQLAGERITATASQDHTIALRPSVLRMGARFPAKNCEKPDQLDPDKIKHLLERRRAGIPPPRINYRPHTDQWQLAGK